MSNPEFSICGKSIHVDNSSKIVYEEIEDLESDGTPGKLMENQFSLQNQSKSIDHTDQ